MQDCTVALSIRLLFMRLETLGLFNMAATFATEMHALFHYTKV